jgi:hypothetical protein
MQFDDMSRLARAVTDHLDAEGWQYASSAHPEGARLRFVFQGEHALLDCWVVCYEATERLAVLARYPIPIPDGTRLAVAEFVTRANFGTLVGNFEFDMDDGELRFKTSADLEGTPLTGPFIRNLLAANLTTADRYFPGLMKVLYARMSPADAIAIIRSSH